MRLLAPLLAVLSLAAPARAGDLVVAVTTGGRPVADAVVMVRPAAGAPAPRPAGVLRMAQQAMQFEPFVLIAPVGSDVAFPNFDRVRHHVYSFSPARTFELKLYGRGESPKIRFDRAGVVGIGCNIHDDMTAFIRVVDTPYAAKTAANGLATIQGLPAGPAQVVVWHPYGRAPAGEVTVNAVAPARGAARLSVALQLRAPRLRHGAY